jgi:methoxymalonate biosynthesis acyl carrier protein
VTTSPDQPDGAAATAHTIEQELLGFLQARTGSLVPTDLDLFASGTLSSMFAMELVVHLEQVFGVAIAGQDLRMENFRTVNAMTALVLRLRMASVADRDA